MAKSENDKEINENAQDNLASSSALSVNVSGTTDEIDTRLAQPRSRRVRHPGRVYFIRAGDYVKIGFSTRPLNRLRGLQVSHPDKLEILCTIPGDHETEQKMHWRFSDLHVRGEWFRFTADLVEFVDRIINPRPVMPEVTRLLKLRDQHGAHTAIGYHCSGLAEALPAFREAKDVAQKANLARSIERLTAGLTANLAAVA